MQAFSKQLRHTSTKPVPLHGTMSLKHRLTVPNALQTLKSKQNSTYTNSNVPFETLLPKMLH